MDRRTTATSRRTSPTTPRSTAITCRTWRTSARSCGTFPMATARVLDHVLIYKGSNMGNSHRHAHEKVPVILVGGIDGTFKGNRHIVFPDNTQRTSNMLLSILHLFGIEQERIGTSTGPLHAAARSRLTPTSKRMPNHAGTDDDVKSARIRRCGRGRRHGGRLVLRWPRNSAASRRARRWSRRRVRCGRSSSRTARRATASMTTRTTRWTGPGGTRSSTPSTRT